MGYKPVQYTYRKLIKHSPTLKDEPFLVMLNGVCYTFILRTIKRFKDENGTILNEHGQRHRAMSVANSNSGRKMQAVGRHKYIYVIGTVLIVDLLFLCPYSGIQPVAFLHINHLIEITHSSTLIRWWLQILIDVHSVCQTLCYFRMTEFRRLACCVTRPWNSRSCSVLNKSFVNTRSVIRDEELLDAMDSPQIREPLLNMTHDLIVNSVSAQARSRQKLTRLRTSGDSAQIIKEDQVDFVDADIEMGAVKKKSAAF
ncbi:unnamed protein product [Cylicocyclus nassatus]|uniref:Uncharacterized protein n=1 Tax=Cylicocyclus nassatus TaxID=53992 RepID=A0AA36DSU0_CYLNA|nr:unnamed protein product [Cylicocyclus nassatus]